MKTFSAKSEEIERDWYVLGEWNLEGGKCRFCETPLPGRFEEAPGDWGSIRVPVRIAQFA